MRSQGWLAWVVMGTLISWELHQAEGRNETASSSDILQDLEFYLDQKIQQFKLDLHKTYETSRLRHKRDIGRVATLPDINALTEERIKIVSARSDYGQSISHYPISCWASVQIMTNHFVFLGTSVGELILFDFHGYTFTVLYHLQTDVAYKIKHFVYRDEVWFVVLHRAGESHYIQLYVFDGNVLFKKQAIHLDGELDIDVLRNRGTWYMGVVSTKNLIGHQHHAQFLLYNWRHTQFDMLAKTTAPGSCSLVMWDVEGTMYVAVAQALAVGGVQQSVGSPVFAYHERDDDKLTYVQIVRANQPKKVLHFTVHTNHYLLFLCSQGVTIYWWAGDQFLEWQVLEQTEQVVDAAVLLLPNGEVAITVLDMHSIRFYMEEISSKYVLVFGLDLKMEHSVAGLSFFYRAADYYYLVAKVREGHTLMMSNMWRLNMTTHYVRNDRKWDPLVTCLVALNDTMKEKKKDLDYIGSQIPRVWVTDKEQTITANVVVHGAVQANREITMQDVHIHSKEPNVPRVTNGQVRKAALDALSHLEDIKADLNGVAYKSRDQTIHGPLRFTKPVAVGDGVMGSIARDVLLNDVPVSALRDSALKVDGDQTVVGDFIVPDVLVHQLEVRGHVNRIKTTDMLLLHGDQLVTGSLHFSPGVQLMRDLLLKKGGTINGLNPDSFVTANTPQVIQGVKTFKNLNAKKNIDVKGMTNNRDLSVMAANAVLTNGAKPISENIEFTGPIIIRGNLIVRGRINGVINLTALMTDAVNVDSQQLISGSKIFKAPVHVHQNVLVDGKTNGIDVSEEVLTLNTEQIIPGNITFLDDVNFLEDLEVGSMNGIDLDKEVVAKSLPHQVVVGRKFFKGGLAVMEDVRTSPHSTLNGVDLADLVLTASKPENFTLYGRTVFQDLTIDGPAMARGTLNGVAMSDFDTLLWRKSLDQVIGGPVSFPGHVVFENDMEVESTVNGFNLDRDFVHTFQDEEVGGAKTFAEDFYIDGPLRMAPGALLNGFDLKETSQSVVRPEGQQVVYGRKVFPKIEVLGNLIVRGTVNGMDLSEELMLTHKEQLVTGHITMTSEVTPVVGRMHSDRIDVEHDVNGVDLSEFASHAVMVDYPSFPLENKNFISGLKVAGIQGAMIDNVDVQHLFHEVVRIDVPQSVHATKNFTDLEFIGLQTGSLNGLDLQEYVDTVVTFTDPIIFGPKTIAGDLKVNGDLKTSGPINGIDVSGLAASALYRGGDNIITAPMAFATDLDIGHLHMEEGATIDEVPWSELVHLDREEFLHGRNRFHENLVVEGNLAVGGLVDGCDLTNLAESAVYRDRNQQTVDGRKTVDNLIINGDISVDGQVNGLDLKQFADKILRKSSDQLITGRVGFYSGVNVQHLTLGNTINRVDIDNLLQDAVLKSMAQEIGGVKIFLHPEGLVVHGDLTVEGDLDVQGVVNTVDVSDLRDTTVYKYGDQLIFGKKIFPDMETLKDIRVAGLVNGVRIPEDLVLKYGDDMIVGDTTFSAPTVMQENLFVLGRINDIDLAHLIGERVTLHNEDAVFANLTFMKPVDVGNLELLESVNDIPVTSLATRSGPNQIIGGVKTFLGNVVVDGDLDTHLVNGVDVRALDARVVRYNRDEHIPGLTVFRNSAVVEGDMSVSGMVNGYSVGNMTNKLVHLREETNRYVDDLKHSVELQNFHLRNQFTAHTYQFSEFAYFDLVQVLPVRMTKLFSSVTYGFNRPALVANPASHLFGWSADECSPRLSDCCSQLTFIFRTEVDGQLSFESGPHMKRLFAFVFSNSTLFTPGYLNGFLLWTNTSTKSRSCIIGGPEETVIVSLHGTGLSTLESKQAMTNFQAEYSPYVEDAKVVEINANIYMLVAYSYSKKDGLSGPTIIYRYDQTTNTWRQYQVIQTNGSIRMDVTQIVVDGHKVTFLAIATRPLTHDATTFGSLSFVYKWDASTQKFMLVKEIPSSSPSSILWVDSDEDLYLFIANEKSRVSEHHWPKERFVHMQHDTYVDPISVYKYSSTFDDFLLMQNIGVKGVVAMSPYKLAGEIFVAVASRAEDAVFLLQLEGYNGFSVVQRIPMQGGVRDLHVYWSKDYRLHLAITSDSQTVVLRSFLRGVSLLPVEGKPLFLDYEALISSTTNKGLLRAP